MAEGRSRKDPTSSTLAGHTVILWSKQNKHTHNSFPTGADAAALARGPLSIFRVPRQLLGCFNFTAS